MPVMKDTPIGEIKGYYRSTLVAALTLYDDALGKARKAEDKIAGETSHIDDKKEIVNELRACLGAATHEAMENTPLGRAMIEGEGKHGQSDPQQTTLEAPGAEADPFAPGEGLDVNEVPLIQTMCELAGLDAENTTAGARAATEEERLAIYRWTKAVQLVGLDGSGVTPEQVPMMPNNFDIDRIPTAVKERMHPGDRFRRESIALMRDALEVPGALDWQKIMLDCGIKTDARLLTKIVANGEGPNAIELVDTALGGPYETRDEGDGYTVSAATSGGVHQLPQIYDRISALARAFVLNIKFNLDFDGGPPTDIAQAKRKRGRPAGTKKKR